MLTHMVQPEEKKGFGEEGRTFGCKNADGTVHGYNYARKKSKEKLLFSRIVVVKMRENSKRIRGMERKIQEQGCKKSFN
jgi:hypothetical protein